MKSCLWSLYRGSGCINCFLRNYPRWRHRSCRERKLSYTCTMVKWGTPSTNSVRSLLVKTSHIQPQTLPPTSAAARYHRLRGYHQIRMWKVDSTISAEEWGLGHQGWPDAWFQLLQICLQRQNFFYRKSDVTVPQIGAVMHLSQEQLNSTACGQCRGCGCTNSTRQLPDVDGHVTD